MPKLDRVIELLEESNKINKEVFEYCKVARERDLAYRAKNDSKYINNLEHTVAELYNQVNVLTRACDRFLKE
jgi:hypothetical protein